MPPVLPVQRLITAPNLGLPGARYRHAYMPGDAFYEQLIDAHRGLSDAHSELLNARLLLLLANHVGDLNVLREALALARAGVEHEAVPAAPSERSAAAPAHPSPAPPPKPSAAAG